MTTMQTSTTLLLIGLLSFGSCNGQTKSEVEKVVQFKDDFLSKKEMYKPDTLQISTAMLTRERYPNVRCITTYPKYQKIKHVEYYYNDTKILESNISYKLPSGDLTGITKHYDTNGQLEYIQDHDKGTWEVVKFDNFPYYQTLVKKKKYVDSLIIANYGQRFFDNHVVWSPEGSAFYNGKGAGATWYDYQEWEPKEFLLRYSIKLSEDEIYDEQFEIHLDSAGKIFFPFNYDDNKGFEKINSKNGFVLTKQISIDKAKQLGLVENDTTKAFTFLSWQFNEDKKLELFNGHFTYNVAINTKTIKHEPKGGRNRIEYKFDVYVFNPWTGQFIEKQKMKSYREWEKLSGQTTGLMPDK
jgi:hypothetical protein